MGLEVQKVYWRVAPVKWKADKQDWVGEPSDYHAGLTILLPSQHQAGPYPLAQSLAGDGHGGEGLPLE